MGGGGGGGGGWGGGASAAAVGAEAAAAAAAAETALGAIVAVEMVGAVEKMTGVRHIPQRCEPLPRLLPLPPPSRLLVSGAVGAETGATATGGAIAGAVGAEAGGATTGGAMAGTALEPPREAWPAETAPSSDWLVSESLSESEASLCRLISRP